MSARPSPLRGARAALGLDATQPLHRFAIEVRGATAVFERLHIDYCCGGRRSLREACESALLDPERVLDALAEAAATAPDTLERWDVTPMPRLADHLEHGFHAAHRAELPRLIDAAAKVERVHLDKPDCPRGLAAELEWIRDSLEAHMRKEEVEVFPHVREGREAAAAAALASLEAEHVEQGENLYRLRALTRGYQAPADACTTWRALYAALERFEHDVHQHVHLENDVLFRSIAAAAATGATGTMGAARARRAS